MRFRKGFTYVEMLVALSIIMLSSAIAVPSLMSLVRRIKLTRLNDEARAVYMSAYEEIFSAYLFGQVLNLSEKPSPNKSGLVYCVLSWEDAENEDAANLISLTKENTSIILEYAKSSASVAGVYLSEDMSKLELEKLYLEDMLSTKEQRERLYVGYYGGDPAKWNRGKLYKIKPKITVHNKEDLFLEVSCSGLPDGEPLDYKIKLTLSGNGSPVEFNTVDFREEVVNNELKAWKLFDSMQPYGEKFALKYPDLSKGEVTATVTVSCREFSGEASVTFDPLYESRDEENIYISCVRHLNNLRYTDNYNAVQTGDICFLNPPSDDFYIKGETHDLTMAPLPELTGKFDGADFIIHNISLTESDNGTGLFESISGSAENIHLAGCAEIKSSESKNVGGICGELKAGGCIKNCSVSEMNISAEEGAYVGGIAGKSEGTIERCSAVFGKITLKSGSSAGGISGHGGRIVLSHSAGKFVLYEDCPCEGVICGIAPQADVKQCYSECGTEYISGYKYYGISDRPASGSYYVSENGWLSSDCENARHKSDLAAEGFERTQATFLCGTLSSIYTDMPESVKKNGILTRFGRSEMLEPRGLIGLIKVTYSGGEYKADLITCFDGYKNHSQNCPGITWDEPASEEVRYYIFRSDIAFPAGGEKGFEYIFTGELGAEFLAEDFYCAQLMESGHIKLRFWEEIFECDVKLDEEEVSEGKVGVMVSSKIFDFEAWFNNPESDGYITDSEYIYRNLLDDTRGEVMSGIGGQYKIPELEEFDPAPNMGESVIYIFYSDNLEEERDFTFKPDSFEGEGFNDILEVQNISGYNLIEIYRGDGNISDFTIDFEISGCSNLHIFVTAGYDYSTMAYFISIGAGPG